MRCARGAVTGPPTNAQSLPRRGAGRPGVARPRTGAGAPGGPGGPARKGSDRAIPPSCPSAVSRAQADPRPACTGGIRPRSHPSRTPLDRSSDRLLVQQSWNSSTAISETSLLRTCKTGFIQSKNASGRTHALSCPKNISFVRLSFVVTKTVTADLRRRFAPGPSTHRGQRLTLGRSRILREFRTHDLVPADSRSPTTLM